MDCCVVFVCGEREREIMYGDNFCYLLGSPPIGCLLDAIL